MSTPNDYRNPSPAAVRTMVAAIRSLEGASLTEIDDAFYGKGVCFNCGADDDSGRCEGDAQYYECSECGEHAVFGYELAIVHVLL